MKLEEAIKHLADSLDDKEHDWGCEERRKEHEQLFNWLLELKTSRAKKEYEQNEKAKYWQEKYDHALHEQLKMEKALEDCGGRIETLQETIQGKDQRMHFLLGQAAVYEKILFRLPWLVTDEVGGD